MPRTGSACRAAACASPRGANRRLRAFAVTQIAASFVLLVGAGMLLATLVALQTRAHRLRHQRARDGRAGHLVLASARAGGDVLQGGAAPHRRGAGRRAGRGGHDRALARRRRLRTGIPVLGRGLRQGQRRGGSARALPHRLARASSRRSAFRSSTGRDFDATRHRRCREGRDREPERGAADVPDLGGAQPRSSCGPIR